MLNLGFAIVGRYFLFHYKSPISKYIYAMLLIIFIIISRSFVLTGKLWVVMGAGWCSELISTIAAPEVNLWYWTIIDMVNELQGVFIFIILVFKPKLYYLIRKRLGKRKHIKNTSQTAHNWLVRYVVIIFSGYERTQLSHVIRVLILQYVS